MFLKSFVGKRLVIPRVSAHFQKSGRIESNTTNVRTQNSNEVGTACFAFESDCCFFNLSTKKGLYTNNGVCLLSILPMQDRYRTSEEINMFQ